MKPESHTLTIRSRRDSDRKDGLCSCELWRVINADIRDVREKHAAHLERELGPDAQDARDASAGE